MGLYQFNPDDAFRFARERGIKTKRYGAELALYECPYCHNKRVDQNAFKISLETGQFMCHRASCGAHGNMLTLAKDFNFSLGDAVDAYLNNGGDRYRDLSRVTRPTSKSPAVKYMESRGISEAITKKYSITTQEKHDNILVFPFFDEFGVLQFVKYRKTDYQKGKDRNKEWCEANCKPILFGMDQCDPAASDTLVITEGQIDSLSVAEAFNGKINAVSVPTGAKGFTWIPYCWDFLGKFREIIVFGDYERGTITLLPEMKQRFHGTVKHVRVEDYLECKDANEMLQKHGRDAIIKAVKQAVPVENARIRELALVQRVRMSDLESISTGLISLDRIIGGFYYGNLIILTGERGKGKSTMGSQFIVNALVQGCSCFVYSGELKDATLQDWLDRQFAGKDNIITQISARGFPLYSIDEICAVEIHNYYRGRCFYYNKEESEDGEDIKAEKLEETIVSAIKQYACRVILLDNLMTAIEDDLNSDLNREQTKFVRTLARIAKSYNVIIILVAHPRKQTVQQFNNDDIAGSSNITNLADVVLRYTDPDEESEGDRVLQVLKNRLTGQTDREGIALWFDEASKRIAENMDYFTAPIGWERPELADVEDFTAVIDNEVPF